MVVLILPCRCWGCFTPPFHLLHFISQWCCSTLSCKSAAPLHLAMALLHSMQQGCSTPYHNPISNWCCTAPTHNDTASLHPLIMLLHWIVQWCCFAPSCSVAALLHLPMMLLHPISLLSSSSSQDAASFLFAMMLPLPQQKSHSFIFASNISVVKCNFVKS